MGDPGAVRPGRMRSACGTQHVLPNRARCCRGVPEPRAARLPPPGHGAPAAVQAPEEAAAAAASCAAAERRAAGRPGPRRARRRESPPRAEYVSPRVAGPCAHPGCRRTAPPLFLGGLASLRSLAPRRSPRWVVLGRPCVDCHAFEFMQRALQDLRKTAYSLDARVSPGPRWVGRTDPPVSPCPALASSRPPLACYTMGIPSETETLLLQAERRALCACWPPGH
ncbi:hypothetical protein MC885_015395 [Smutsia gigantea]|nr:hypothetical protein MC885_015395 [Smutsia gigantea]